MANPLKKSTTPSTKNAVRIDGSLKPDQNKPTKTSSVKPNVQHQNKSVTNVAGVNSAVPNKINATEMDNESNRTPTMTIENESVFNSQTSPGTPNPRGNRRRNTPYTSTGTRKRSTRKSLNFVRKKKVGGKLVEIGKTKNRDISELIDKIIINNNLKSVPKSDISSKYEKSISTTPNTKL